MDPRYVVFEFWGGPLDGFHNGWTTDAEMNAPDRLVATFNGKRSDNGVYHLRERGANHYVYQWQGVLE
jgi:hypothetical protein